MLDIIAPEPGYFYVMDRAHVDFLRLHWFHSAGAFFVTRTKRGILFRRRYSHSVDVSAGVHSDHTVLLASAASRKRYPDALRRVPMTPKMTATCVSSRTTLTCRR